VYHSFSFFSIERETSGDGESRKEAEENKENVRQDHCFTDALGSIYDIEGWNESVISGGFTALLLIHVIFTPKSLDNAVTCYIARRSAKICMFAIILSLHHCVFSCSIVKATGEIYHWSFFVWKSGVLKVVLSGNYELYGKRVQAHCRGG